MSFLLSSNAFSDFDYFGEKEGYFNSSTMKEEYKPEPVKDDKKNQPERKLPKFDWKRQLDPDDGSLEFF